MQTGLDISVLKYRPLGGVVLVCINILDQMLVVQHILLIMLVSGPTPGMLSKSPAYIR